MVICCLACCSGVRSARTVSAWVRQNKNHAVKPVTSTHTHTQSHTDNDYLWLLICGHVDGGPGDTGKDQQGQVQEIHFDWDVMRWGTVLVAHLDLQRRRKSNVVGLAQNRKLSTPTGLTVKSKGRPGLKYFIVSLKDTT